MKKVFALLLSVLLVLSLSVAAFAVTDTDSVADKTAPGFKIEIANAIVSETYKAYKVFDVAYARDNASATATTNADGSDATHEHNVYAYTITYGSAWWSVVTDGASPELSTNPAEFTAHGLKFTKTTGTVGTAAIYTVEEAAGFSAADFAKYLSENIPSAVEANPDGTGTATAYPDSEQTVEDLAKNIKRGMATISLTDAGYYFVTTTTGALCSLDTTEPTAKIVEKNDIPDVDKSVSDTGADGSWGKKTDVDVGDTVYYKIDVTTGTGNNSAITLHDKMDSALTLNKKTAEGADTTFVVKVGETVVPATETVSGTERVNYTIDYNPADGDTFDIVFSAAYITALGDDKEINVYFDATLNENAKIYGEPNDNETYIDYSNQSSSKPNVQVYTYEFDIVKVDTDGKLLPGAEFTLTRSAATKRDGETDPIQFVKTADGYRVAKDGETGTVTTLTSEDGKYHLYGLDAGVYTLTETKAPTGFNLAKDPITVVIKGTTDGDKQGKIYKNTEGTQPWETALYKEAPAEGEEEAVLTDTVEVINRTGSELPSTGGIGTTIFYIVGGVLLLGAAIVLIARRRTQTEA